MPQNARKIRGDWMIYNYSYIYTRMGLSHTRIGHMGQSHTRMGHVELSHTRIGHMGQSHTRMHGTVPSVRVAWDCRTVPCMHYEYWTVPYIAS